MTAGGILFEDRHGQKLAGAHTNGLRRPRRIEPPGGRAARSSPAVSGIVPSAEAVPQSVIDSYLRSDGVVASS